MMPASWFQMVLYGVVLLALAWPLGRYMAQVYEGHRPFLAPLVAPVERLLYRAAGVAPQVEMGWRTYAAALLIFNGLGLVVVYALQRLQGLLPLNPQALGAVPTDLAWNTAVSFATNTNWQSYSGEVTLSYLTQMAGMTVQNCVSAATGLAALAALTRGLAQQGASTVGNFWVDLVCSTLYILLPLALVVALALVSQGVVRSLRPAVCVPLLQTGGAETQVLPLGPAASQIAIKQLGTNGGGFFGAYSAHPFENPTPLANFIELLAILLIPVALCFTFGRMVGDQRQGWAVLAAMTVIFVGMVTLAALAEQAGNPALTARGVDQAASAQQAGGNMEGKEVRFGIANSVLWATATTAASNGSVNSIHDSYTPLGGLAPLWLMQLGEIIYGGVGSGLYGLLAFALVAAFVAGLMVGRTPEYLGKKIEAYEMKMASLLILLPVLVVLLGTATAVLAPSGRAAILNPGAHGFSEVLYAFSSAGNNNGSAFAGLSSNNFFYNVALGLSMLIARYWLVVPALALAGALARKQKAPAGAGTLPTHSPLFVVWLIGIIVVVGALSYLPALALGPIVE